MPEHLRALIVIVGLATVVFAFAKGPVCAGAMSAESFKRRRNLWFGITLAAFLAHNFWIFIIVSVVLLAFAVPREPNKLAMFFFLLFAVPPYSAEITGLGIMRYVFEINYIRLLTLTILLPLFLSLWRQPESEPFGRSLPDKLITAYIILQILLILVASTVTDTLRQGFFYNFVDVFLPYYVASRSLKNLEGFRDALTGFVIAALVLAAMGVFEFMRHWLLYSSLQDALGVRVAGGGRWLERGVGSGILRAQASTNQPIVLGYVMAVAVGFFVYLRKSVPNRAAWGLGLILLAGLIAPVSRGPWVGAAAIVLLFVATGPSGGARLVRLAFLGAIMLPFLLVSPIGERIIDYLPFVGAVESENVIYRQRLLGVATEVIMQNPWFGDFASAYSSEMEEMRTGEGIIDLVNTFVAIGLASGLVGLFLFSGFFIATGIGTFRSFRMLTDKNDELYRLGQMLFSILAGVVVMIFTVSSISFIPVIYWSVAGLCVAYSRMLVRGKASAVTRPTKSRSATAGWPRRNSS